MRLFVACLLAAWIVAAVESTILAGLGAGLTGVGLASLPGTLLGALAASAVALVRWLRDRRWPRPEAPVPAGRSWLGLRDVLALVAGVATALGTLLATPPVARRLLDLQDLDVAVHLTTIGTCGAVAAGAAAAVAAGRLVDRWTLDEGSRLGRTLQAPWLHRPLLVTLPAWLLLGPLVTRHGRVVGGMALAASLLLVVATALAMLAPLRRLQQHGAWWIRGPGLGLLFVAAGLGALAVRGYDGSEQSAAASQTPLASLGAASLRLLGDLDRDGASALLGGRDCAPFDPERNPAAIDVPANGVDEDCDGVDATVRRSTSPGRTFSDLAPGFADERPNVLWIIVDALRADHVGVLHGGKGSTPALDRFAAGALVFTRATSQSSATALSFPSMLSGRNAGAMTWEKRAGHLQPAARHRMIAERLKAAGYRTSITLTAYTISNLPGIQRGYERVETLELDRAHRRRWNDRSSPVAATKAIQLVEAAVAAEPRRPFFVTAYFPDPHAPYVAHPETPGALDLTGPRDRYDSEVAFADRYVGLLIDYLEHRAPLWERTIVIVTADHGEEFGEHGGKYHAGTCHVESVHVPLMLRVPRVQAKRVKAPVGLVDIVPTLLELLGLQKDAGELDGQSLLVPALAPQLVTDGRPVFCAVASQRDKYGSFHRRSVRAGSFTLLQDVSAGTLALFDAAADPGELRDLAREPAHAQRARALRELLVSVSTGNLKPHDQF